MDFFGGVTAGADDTDEFCEEVSDGEGDGEVVLSPRLLRTLVSIGSGANLGFLGVAELSAGLLALLLLTVVSTGSTANFLLLLTDVSTGAGRTRRFAACSDMLSLEFIWLSTG